MLSGRAQVAVVAGFAVLVLATIGLAVYLLAGLGDGDGSGRPDDDAAAAPPRVRDEDARAACTGLAAALEPVVPLLTAVPPTADDPVRGQAVRDFLDATDDLDLAGWFARWQIVLAADMGLLAFAPDDAEQYAQRYADYVDALARLADACRVQEVAVPEPVT